MGRLVVMALLPLLVGGCAAPVAQGAAGGPLGVSTPGERTTATTRTAIGGLTCPDDVRGVGSPDYFSSTGGARTPEDAVRLLADPQDEVVIEDRRTSAADAYLLRADGTAHTRLELVVLSDGTWRVEGIESCGDEGPPRG